MEKQNHFRYKHTLLLYLVYEGYKSGALTLAEKSKMKELILNKHPIIYKHLHNYEKNGQVDVFWVNLKELIKDASLMGLNTSAIIMQSECDSEPSFIKDIIRCSSPVDGKKSKAADFFSSSTDSALIQKKKKRKKLEKEFKEKSEESTKDSEYSNFNFNENCNNSINYIKMCNEGGSPDILIKKHYNEEAYFFQLG